jgi:Fic family protein
MTNLDQLLQQIKLKKQQLDQHQPIDSWLITNLWEWLRIELTYTSNAIEGNTLSRMETSLVVNEGISVPGKRIIELIEAKNHAQALTYIETLASQITINQITQDHILEIHRIILSGINDTYAGSYRTVPVRITGSQTILPNHIKVPDLMDQLETRIKQTQDDPISIACDLHYDFVTIHPFIDGNGRTARLLFNLVLLIAGYPLSFITVWERLTYIKSLEQAQTWWSHDDYSRIMYQSIDRSLSLYLDSISNTQATTISDDTLPLLKIGQLAQQTWEPVATLRYRTKLWLIHIHDSMENSGYVLYHPDTIQTIQHIRNLQQNQRLSLDEIKALL